MMETKDIVLDTLTEALNHVKGKQKLAQRNLDSSTYKVEALEKALADYSQQLTLDVKEIEKATKRR